MNVIVLFLTTFGLMPFYMGAQSEEPAKVLELPEQEIHRPDHPDDNVLYNGQQELGLSMGVSGGTNLAPGGLVLAGAYLYRMVGNEWLEMGVRFIRGGSEAGCFRDRQDEVECNYGFFAGSTAELSLSFRHYFDGPLRFRPFIKLGTGVRLIEFRGDDSRGLGIPLRIGGGLRARVSKHLVAVGQFEGEGGYSYLNQNIDSAFWASLNVMAGLEISIN